MSLKPKRIRLDKPRRVVVIEWDDGVSHEFPWAYLRSKCPSATEKAARDAAAANPLQVLKQVPSSDLESLRPVGNYALSPTWADGHAFGIYTWEYLRQIADDPQVTKTNPNPSE